MLRSYWLSYYWAICCSHNGVLYQDYMYVLPGFTNPFIQSKPGLSLDKTILGTSFSTKNIL